DALDAEGAAKGRDRPGLGQEFVVLQVLLAQLHKGSAAPDGGLHLAADALRSLRPGPVRDGVEPELFGLQFHIYPLQNEKQARQNKASLRHTLQYFPTLALSKSGRVEAEASSQPSSSSP